MLRIILNKLGIGIFFSPPLVTFTVQWFEMKQNSVDSRNKNICKQSILANSKGGSARDWLSCLQKVWKLGAYLSMVT